MLKKNKTAFSLIELSIVILIIAIMIAGALSVSINSINDSKTKLTNERIKIIYKALGAYISQNNALPCPAAITATKNSLAYGAEVTSSGACTTATGVYASANNVNLYYGMVPTLALGLSSEIAEDGFGSKFAYIVDKRMHASFGKIADPPVTGTTPYFSTSSPFEPKAATIVTKECLSASCTTSRIVTSYGAFAIISYGMNKSGAYNSDSATQNTRSTDYFEMTNDVTPDATPYFYFNNMLAYSSLNKAVYDDIVFSKSRNQMAVDLGLMDKIYCTKPGDSYPNNTNYDYYSYGMMAYGTSACAGRPNSIRLAKKCGPFGRWIDIVGTCP